MRDLQTLHVSVNCPRDRLAVYNVAVDLAYNGERWIPLPCNGCDQMSGGSACEKCRASITLMFFDDPDLDFSSPLTPSHPKVR